MEKKVCDTGTLRRWPPFPLTTNTRHSPRRRPSRRSPPRRGPSTSQRRSPPSRLRLDHRPVPSRAQGAHGASTSAGSRMRGRRRTARTSGAPPSSRRARRVGRPRGDGVGADIAPGEQVAVEARHRGQVPLDGRRRQPARPVADAQHVPAPGRARRCEATNASTSAGTTSPGSLATTPPGSLATTPKNSLQVMRVGPHGVGPGPCAREFQEVVDEGVADLVDAAVTAGTRDRSERWAPGHRVLLWLGKSREDPWALNPGGGSPVQV